MAYQNVGTPRFYVNVIEWLDSLGMTESNGSYGLTIGGATDVATTNMSMSFWHTLSASSTGLTIPASSNDDYQYIKFPVQGISYSQAIGKYGFVAYLGHRFGSVPGDFRIWTQCKTAEGTAVDIPVTNAGGVNYDTPDVPIGYDGFSICLGDYSAVTQIPTVYNYDGSIWYRFSDEENGYSLKINSIVLGSYYDMPHSPDLSLTMTREYGGIKTIETKGGASLSNAFYTGNPKWGDLGAWELGSSNPKLSRSGRRIWSLSFSYLDDGDVWGSNQSLLTGSGSAAVYGGDIYTAYDADDLESNGNDFTYNILTDDNFYSQVIHKTNGGQLPFIFQPDVNDNTQFAIAKFDSGFNFEQVANGVYNVKLKIREVW